VGEDQVARPRKLLQRSFLGLQRFSLRFALGFRRLHLRLRFRRWLVLRPRARPRINVAFVLIERGGEAFLLGALGWADGFRLGDRKIDLPAAIVAILGAFPVLAAAIGTCGHVITASASSSR